MRSSIRWTRPRAVLALTAAAVATAVGVQACDSARGAELNAANALTAGALTAADNAQIGAAAIAFRNTVKGPPPGWTGQVFQLSRDYPTLPPGPCRPEVCRWLTRNVDFRSPNPQVWEGAWAQYMNDILEYVKQGQTLMNGWDVRVGGETRWFHVPWMAYDSVRGREFIHGTTNERTADISDFRGQRGLHFSANSRALNRTHRIQDMPKGLNTLTGNDSSTAFETWAVGFYNPPAGYAIGQMIPRDGVPRANRDASGRWTAPGMPFPEGTVVAKVLFSTATPTQVPYLRGAPRWIVDRHIQVSPDSFINRRRPAPVYLVQLDVAVNDSRSPTGWVYGTFAYNGTINDPDVWKRMSPVGLQWGSDPRTWPAVDSASSRPVSESVIAPINIYQHLGCAGRLAGPVDNRESSCISCHQGAFTAAPVGTVDTMPSGNGTGNIPPIFGFNGMCKRTSPSNMAYFSNIRYPQDYPPFPGMHGERINLDGSLQVQVAYMQYATWLHRRRTPTRRR
ncbi:MAG TPA: hypothetical protein VEX86_27575 [Longimicrobium sp.]|nr:hypothetical protein [Longimicrobium sp.]